MTLKSQPGDFSVASHGNVKVKEGETVDMLIDPHRESRAHRFRNSVLEYANLI
jgi:hypothetical protein